MRTIKVGWRAERLTDVLYHLHAGFVKGGYVWIDIE